MQPGPQRSITRTELTYNRRQYREQVTAADACAVKRAEQDRAVLRCYAEIRHGAKSWKSQRRVVVRIEAGTLGMDIRYVVTSLTESSAEHIYDSLYCARGQAENLPQ